MLTGNVKEINPKLVDTLSMITVKSISDHGEGRTFLVNTLLYLSHHTPSNEATPDAHGYAYIIATYLLLEDYLPVSKLR